MNNILHKYIAIDPRVMGGEPVIAGTRIPIERVYHLIKQGYSTQTLEKEYPHVGSQKIQHVIAYLVKRGLNEFKKTQKIKTTS